MALAPNGRALTDEEVREFNAYGSQGLSLPDKFNGVVAESINGSRVYRYPTAEEVKAGEEASKAAAVAQEASEKLMAKAREDAAKRAIPAAPPPPAPPAS